MKFRFVVLSAIFLSVFCYAQEEEYQGQSCTSIMVGRLASTDGSVITSHTCDGRYRTWAYMEPAADHVPSDRHEVLRGTMSTNFHGDTTGVRKVGEIPEAAHTYAYLNTAYPCLNEVQLAIGETTFGGPDILVNPEGMFTIEELERIALQRCDNARDAVILIGGMVEQYGYGDSGECITIADKNEVWQMEIIGAGKDVIGGVWAAQRVPDDEVAVSANIPRIGRMMREDSENFLASDNAEDVALKYGLWDGTGDFKFWKAFNCDYAEGRNFSIREWFIMNTLAPSLGLKYDAEELPFSVKPDEAVDVRDVMALLRSTYEGTEHDMCANVTIDVPARDTIPAHKAVSPVANPWLTTTMRNTLNSIAPGTVDFRRTVSVAWCAYSTVIQLRNWLPDSVGGVCWFALDNPGQSPRIPVFCGTTRLPEAYDRCGQNVYDPDCALWTFRKANKLATLAWQSTKKDFMKNVMSLEDEMFEGLDSLEKDVFLKQPEGDPDAINKYTATSFEKAAAIWKSMEESLWLRFGLGF